MNTHNLCFEKKYKKYGNVLSENFPFLVVKFSINLNRRVFVMMWRKYSDSDGEIVMEIFMSHFTVGCY